MWRLDCSVILYCLVLYRGVAGIRGDGLSQHGDFLARLLVVLGCGGSLVCSEPGAVHLN
jgi:hypothetical protein